jgi:triosephosphate isomerase
MNLAEPAAAALAAALARALPFDSVDAAVAPAFPSLRAVLDAVEGSPLAVAAQNVHWESDGAFTGEVAASMLAAMGVRLVIVGHSERRRLFGETDESVALKAAAVARCGLIPLVCVGETESQRDSGQTHDVIVGQVRAALSRREAAAGSLPIVAYEPVWAIGTGKTPNPADVAGAHGAIREALTEILGPASSSARVLYGGSVTAANARSLLASPLVDGALVGGASLAVASFRAIADAAAAC